MTRLDNVEDVFPLSPTQQGLLFHSLDGAQSAAGMEPAYVEQVVWRIRGDLDPDALRQAWRYVVDRHAALRAAFVWQGMDEPLQVVRAHVRVPVTAQDWSDTDPAARDERLAAFLREERVRGFDLSHAPLLRIHLLRLDGGQYWLVWTFHHLLVDGWSIGVVLRELLAGYDAFRRGGGPELPPAPPYRHYIAWLQSQDLAAAEHHWRAALAGYEHPTPLPGVREPAATPRFAERGLVLDRETTDALLRTARTERLTINVLATGAWALLLHRYTDRDDVVFGVTLAGRPERLPRADEMVGVFINTLPLRATVDGAVPVTRWLAGVQDQLAGLLQYQATPLPKVQTWSQVPRGDPLFTSLVVFENYPLDAAVRHPADGLEISLETIVENTNYPVTLVGAPGEKLSFRLLYDASRIDTDTVDRLLRQYATLLAGIAADPRRPIRDLPLIPPAESELLLRQWSGTASGPPPALTVHEAFQQQATRTPDAIAVSCGGRRLTYRDLDRRANRLARYLRELGVRREEPVAVALERSPDLVVALLGVLKAGGCYLPLDAGYPGERLALMLADSGATITLTDCAQQEWLPAGTKTVNLAAVADVIGGYPDTPPGTDVGPEQLAYIMYTSGSTGRPKGTEIPHRGIVRLVCDSGYASFAPDEVFLHLAPVSFDASTFEIWGPLLNGGRLAIYPDTVDLDELAVTVHRERVTTLWLTAGLFHQVVTHRPAALGPLHQLLAGGDVLSPAQVRAARSAFPRCRLVNGYGPTENTTFTCYYSVPGADLVRDPVPIGVPVDGTHVYVLDRDMRPVPIAVPGELYVGGYGLARGYRHQPALTAQAFVPDPFADEPGARLYRTGDLVRWDASGVLEFLGRLDNQVKIRGFRVEPGEVEAVLRQHPAVRDAAVVAQEDRVAGKRLVAYAVGRAGADPSTLRAFLRERLPDYLIPADVVMLDALPLTPNGKTDRRALPAMASTATRAREVVAPRTPAEEVLARIWADVLGVDQVGIHDNFFELGGDSILGIRVIAQAHEEGVHINPRLLFQHPTIAELAAVASGAQAAAPQGPVVGPVPLTPIQHWFFEQDFTYPHHWNQTLVLRPKEPLDLAAVATAAEALVTHHDALRLRFEHSADGWRQHSAAPDALAGPVAEPHPLGEPEQLQTSLDLRRGPLLRVAVVEQDEQQLVLFVAHHLVVDAVSWHTLLKDFDRVYRQVRAGDRPSLPAKTTSYQDWAAGLALMARTDSVRAGAEFWTSLPAVGPLPRDADGENVERFVEHVSVQLGSEATSALSERAGQAYHMRVDELLIAALSRAIARWTGSNLVGLTVESHGRDLPVPGADLSRTVGWFTNLFPVVLDVPATDDPMETLVRTKEQFRSMASRSGQYPILRYLTPDGPPLPPLPEITFNYLGHLDAEWRGLLFEPILPDEVGNDRSLQARRAFAVEVTCFVHRGHLQALFSYSSGLHRQDTIARLAHEFESTLDGLVAHCLAPGAGKYTPADFPEAGVRQEDLDTLLTMIREKQS